jgi:hypothetical protein
VSGQATGVASGGIGLLRRDFEAAYGAGTEAEGLVTYAAVGIGAPGATAYAQYRGDVLEHLEVQWVRVSQAGGIDWGTSYQAAMSLLPADAEYRDQFWLPATPEGPIEIIAHTYESAALNAAQYNLGRVLVTFHRRQAQLNPGTPAEPVTTAITLTMAEVGQ